MANSPISSTATCAPTATAQPTAVESRQDCAAAVLPIWYGRPTSTSSAAQSLRCDAIVCLAPSCTYTHSHIFYVFMCMRVCALCLLVCLSASLLAVAWLIASRSSWLCRVAVVGPASTTLQRRSALPQYVCVCVCVHQLVAVARLVGLYFLGRIVNSKFSAIWYALTISRLSRENSELN